MNPMEERPRVKVGQEGARRAARMAEIAKRFEIKQTTAREQQQRRQTLKTWGVFSPRIMETLRARSRMEQKSHLSGIHTVAVTKT